MHSPSDAIRMNAIFHEKNIVIWSNVAQVTIVSNFMDPSQDDDVITSRRIHCNSTLSVYDHERNEIL